jgi:hypothetical protein
MSHRHHRSTTLASNQPNRAQTTATRAPENKTLEWHKKNFANQQKAWQKQSIEAPGTQRPARLDKPLPVRRRQTDDRGTLRIANPDAESTYSRSTSPQRGNVVDGKLAEPGLLAKSRSAHSSIRRKPLGTGNRSESISPHANHTRTLHSAHPTPRLHALPHMPAPPAPGGRKTHAQTPPRSAVGAGDGGLLDLSIGVYDFRGSLPAELQPKEQPLRWDSEPAPQIPPLASSATPNLYEDADVAKFVTADRSGLQPFQEKMPVATTIVKGRLDCL